MEEGKGGQGELRYLRTYLEPVASSTGGRNPITLHLKRQERACNPVLTPTRQAFLPHKAFQPRLSPE